ncbi:MAG: hypothetical protein JKX99_10210 [Robiginitomaculum sp.]|nr:hypothetical protein [Robiginitomaculum sp.]
MEKFGYPNQKHDNIVDIEPINLTSNPGPNSGDVTVAPSDSETSSSQHVTVPTRNPKSGGWILLGGGFIALMWSAGALAYLAGMIGTSGLLALPPLAIAGLLFGTLGPALFIIVLAWALTEIISFAKAARHIGQLAERFSDPAKATREDATAMSTAVQTQIIKMNKAVEGTLARLGAMEEVLNHHSEAFEQAEQNARQHTDTLINDLRREREAVGDLADQLDHKAADIAKVIAEQSKMVVSAADIANSQTIEGAKTLTKATEHLANAAARTRSESYEISAQLMAGADQIENTAKTLSEARHDLEISAGALQVTQSNAAEVFNGHKGDAAKLIEASSICADQLQTVAKESAQNMKRTLDETLDQARHYTSILREEGRSLAESHQGKTKELKNAAIEAKNALDIYTDTIAKRLEHTNEASFSAASWADKTLEKLQDATGALDQRLQALPVVADATGRKIEETFRNRLAGLNAAALAASNEAKGIDAAFQSRIQQNYALLSDFMLKMGVTAAPKSGPIEVPNPLPVSTVEPAKTRAPTPEPVAAVEPKLEPKLEPKPTSDKDGWRWKDVLSRIDGTPAQTQNPTIQSNTVDRLVTIFQELDIQPDQLFDATSYRAAALARLTHGHKAMSDVVRVDAAAIIERLQSALYNDPALRNDAELFVTELRHKVDQAANSGQQMHVETHLRTGDGPAYLLLEAALVSQS